MRNSWVPFSRYTSTESIILDAYFFFRKTHSKLAILVSSLAEEDLLSDFSLLSF